MRPYLSLMKIRYTNDLQYRAAAAAGCATQLAFGLIFILVYYAFYREGGAEFPMEMKAVASYIWLEQAFLALFMGWFFDREILNGIQSGTVAVELCRPVNLYRMWYVKTLAVRFSKATLRFAPILLVAALLPEPIGLSLPASFGAFCLFAVTMLLGVLVLTSLTMLVYTATFYTLSPAGITQIAMVTIEFFSGQLLPLPFYPPVLYKICSWLPFASISNVPFRIYSGDLAGGAMAQAIALQAFWLVALTALGSAWNRRALRRVVVQGG